MTQYIGKFGEYTALSRLLINDIEAYPAIKVNQQNYDLTAITKQGRVVRIEVKSTELHNSATNNTIGALAKTFDFLVVVVAQGQKADCYVMTHAEAIAIKAGSLQLGITESRDGKKRVKESIAIHLERWNRIRDFSAPQDSST